MLLTRSAIGQTCSLVTRNTTFIKNSGALIAGALGAAGFGFAFWWIASRVCAPPAVGRTAAYLSLMGLIGLLGEAGLGTLLAGEIMRHPGRERALTGAAGGVAVALSGAAGCIALLVSAKVTRSFSGPDRGLMAAIFVPGCCFTGLSMVIDQALLGMLRGTFRMLRQILFSGGKLVLLIVMTARFSNETVIMLSWVIAQLISLIVTGIVAWRPGKPMIEKPDFRLLNTLKAKVLDHYLLDVTLHAPGIIMPYLVAVSLSPRSNAAFSALWMIFSVVSILPATLATVLFPDVRAAPHAYREKMLLSLRISLVFALAFGLMVLFSSRLILALFNPAYPDIAGNSLRFLGFGLIGAVIKFHVCAGARLTNGMRKAALWFGLAAIWELVSTVIGGQLGQLEGLALAWVVAVLAEGLLMLGIASRQPEWTMPTSGLAGRPRLKIDG